MLLYLHYFTLSIIRLKLQLQLTYYYFTVVYNFVLTSKHVQRSETVKTSSGRKQYQTSAVCLLLLTQEC